MKLLFPLIVIAFFSVSEISIAQSTEASLHDRARLSTVFLRATGRSNTGVPYENLATGFIVNDRGNILTVNHLVSDLSEIDPESLKIEARIGSKNAPVLTASIYDAKPNRDLLLLDVDDTDTGPAFCIDANFKPERLARTLYTVGFPRVLPIIFEEGKIISSGGPNGSWITNIAFEGGQSGSPVYDEGGKVIGLAKGQLRDNDAPVPGLYVILPIGDAEGLVPSWRDAVGCGERISASPIPEPSQDEITACVQGSLNETIEDWVVTGGARAEGSGPAVERKTAERNICYSAPPHFAILRSVKMTDKGNNGGRGSISQTDYFTEGDNATKACVQVTAWGADGPFGAGGWQNVELTGQIIEVPTSDRKSALEATCRNRIRSAVSNVSVQ